MERRNFLASLASLLGAAAIPQSALAAQAKSSLPAAQRALLTAFVDSFIPRTDSPGAVDAGIPAKFAHMISVWASAANRTAFLGHLSALDARARTHKGKRFASLSSADRLPLLKAFDAEQFNVSSYRRMREIILILYYNSEAGATRELRYERDPGSYQPSLPVIADTRASAGMSHF